MAMTRYMAPSTDNGRVAVGSMHWASPPPNPAAPLPRVAVLVACYGALEHTKRLVSTLAKNAGCEYELVLLDDACPEETWRWAEQQGIRCLRAEKNVGLPTTLNRGVAATDAPIIALWNSDLLIEPNGLLRLVHAAMDTGIAAQTGAWFQPGGRYVAQTEDVNWADYPEGYCLVIRRDVWDAVGEWDPIFFPSIGDDSDWSLRARLKGYRFDLVPNTVQHIGGQSAGKVVGINEVVRRAQAILRDRYGPQGLGMRFLVKRQGATGDLLMLTPALRALRRRYPLSKIHVWCERTAAEALRDNPDVDAVWDREPYAEGSEFRYTQVFELDRAYETGQVVGRWEHPARLFCRMVGEEYDGEGLTLRLSVEEREWARALLPADQHLIAVAVRSACRSKINWQASEWLALANSLPPNTWLVAMDQHPRPPLSPNGASYQDQQFYQHPRVLDLTGQTPSFRHAAAVLSQCQECLSVDTGLLHAAQALGVPVTGLFAASPQDARLLEGGQGIQGAAPCFPCPSGDECGRLGEGHCLSGVTAAQVLPLLAVPDYRPEPRPKRPRT